MRLAVFGAGYVGLVLSACFAEMGNSVTCIEPDENKLEKLQKGEPTLYEHGLQDLLKRNLENKRLNFLAGSSEITTDISVYFVTVGTPSSLDGEVDLQAVREAAMQIGKFMNQYSVVVIKSTVPVGTAEEVEYIIHKELEERNLEIEFDVVSNPEFLKQGSAVKDFMSPDRIIIGTSSQRAQEIMTRLYAPFTKNHERSIFMSNRAAEMTKYAANAMIATKISFMNEIAKLCEALEVDVESVRHGVGSDSRIGYSFIYPGCGFGGSCLPKDVRTLIKMSQEGGVQAKLLEAVQEINEEQKHLLFEKLQEHFEGDLNGKTVALWGLAFKPETDDVREAPSLALLYDLVEAGARVQSYDPAAMNNLENVLPREWVGEKVKMVTDQYEALKNVDALLLVTEWKPFRQPDFELMKKIMRVPLILDGRNQYDPEEVSRFGFEYDGIGR